MRNFSRISTREYPHDKKIVEFYAGVGTIGLSLLPKAKQLILSEFNKVGKRCFEENLKPFSPDLQKKATYHELDARKGASLLVEGEVVIVDPPRKGIEPALFEKILASPILEELIYISCGWAAFKRESEILLQKGFKLLYAKGYLFFPGTNHIEILAHFSRTNSTPN